MADESQSWTLAFRDRALEAEYQRAQSADVQRSFRALAVLAVLMWPAMVPVDRATSGSAANLHVLYIVRFAVGLPLGVLGAALGFTPPAVFARFRQVAVALVVAMFIGAPCLMALVVPEPRVFNDAGASSAQLAGLLGASVLAVYLGVRLELIAAAHVLFAVFAKLYVDRYPGPDNPKLIFAVGSTIFGGLLSAYLVDRYKRSAFVNARGLARERQRSEQLLKNMLPEAVAERLKDDTSRIAEHFDAATVMFADIVGFTPLSAELAPSALVELLDEVFSGLDEIAHRHGLEKIKTIGDAYMVVGGVPVPRPDHAAAVAAMALEMRAFVAARRFPGDRKLVMRIGIHSGPVVAGVIGKKKLFYDLWGDTVNTASRMESHGEPGRIQVTGAVRELLGDRYVLEPRGAIDVKGKGQMETWFLENARDA